MSELTTTKTEEYKLAEGKSDQLGHAIDNFVDHLNLGLIEIEKRLYQELAGLTDKELRLIYKVIDPDMLLFAVRLGCTYKTAIKMFYNGKKARIDEKWRNGIAEKIERLSDELAMELSYRIYALGETKSFLENEAKNLI